MQFNTEDTEKGIDRGWLRAYIYFVYDASYTT